MDEEVKQVEIKNEVVKRGRRSTTSANEKLNSIGKIRLKRLNEDAIVPTRATDGSAGYDLYSTESFVLDQFNWHAFPTGWAIEVPPGYEAQIRSRSGLALQEGTFVLNSPGTIDSDYRGEIKVILYHLGNSDILISSGHRIAQIVFNKVYSGDFDVVEELPETSRGEGGFGSTGIEPLGI